MSSDLQMYAKKKKTNHARGERGKDFSLGKYGQMLTQMLEALLHPEQFFDHDGQSIAIQANGS